ncbi:MAG: radical SAM protein [Candidatus Omnitrophica bacterium]|nr:radical SAM protein [Candidatus Omnitrophota bacterium]
MNSYLKNNLIFDILQDKVTQGPQIANLYINSNCNLGCEYCWFHSFWNKNKPKKQIIPLSLIKKNILALKKLGTKYIVLSSHGEPWLHPEITKIINFIKKNGLFLRITTNLTFSDKQLKLAFGKANFLAVNFSAPTQKLYSKIHNPTKTKTYNNLISNLKLYSMLYKKVGTPYLEVRYIITKNNYKFIPKSIELARKLDIGQLRFRLLDTTRYTKKLSLTSLEIAKLKRIIKKVNSKHFPVKTNLKSLYSYLSKDNTINFSLNRCFIGWLRISLELNGDIGFCCQNDKLIFGNWKRDSIKKSWYNQKAQKIRLKSKYNFDIKKDFWKSCKFCFIEKDNKSIDSILKKFKR